MGSLAGEVSLGITGQFLIQAVPTQFPLLCLQEDGVGCVTGSHDSLTEPPRPPLAQPKHMAFL